MIQRTQGAGIDFILCYVYSYPSPSLLLSFRPPSSIHAVNLSYLPLRSRAGTCLYIDLKWHPPSVYVFCVPPVYYARFQHRILHLHFQYYLFVSLYLPSLDNLI